MRLESGDSWWLWLDTTLDHQLYNIKEQMDQLRSSAGSSGNMKGLFK